MVLYFIVHSCFEIFTLYNSLVYRSVNHMNIVSNKLSINPVINKTVQESATEHKMDST